MTQLEKVALVSGANKGIGFEIARGLGRAHVRVVLGARDEQRGRQAERALRDEGLDVTWLALDVTDPGSVDRARAEIARRWERLDILINNAGTASLMPEAMAEIYATNVFGLARLTRAMVPLLARSRGRVINLSTALGSMGRLSEPEHPVREHGVKYWQYAASKASVNALTALFAIEFGSSGITVNAVCPGYCATDLNGNSGPRSAAQGAQIALKVALASNPGTGQLLEDEGVVPW